MYLSCLLVDVGDNPDRPRPGRLWLRNRYHVHQRLCMAFPSASRISNDAEFLRPYKPADFGVGQVHVAREAHAGFLFRIDPRLGGRAAVLVQSAIRPNWDYAFHNACYFLAAPPQIKSFTPAFENGQPLRFCLVANPTKKIDTIKKEQRQNFGKKELKGINGRHGKRVPVPADKLYEWLSDRAEQNGFCIDTDSTTIQPGYVNFKKPQNAKSQRLRSVRYDGVLKVTDSDQFQQALSHGIGSAKAFGFGLLSVAPLNQKGVKP